MADLPPWAAQATAPLTPPSPEAPKPENTTTIAPEVPPVSVGPALGEIGAAMVDAARVDAAQEAPPAAEENPTASPASDAAATSETALDAASSSSQESVPSGATPEVTGNPTTAEAGPSAATPAPSETPAQTAGPDFSDGFAGAIKAAIHDAYVHGFGVVRYDMPNGHVVASRVDPEEYRANQPSSDASGMSFSDALKCIKRGQRVARAGWNGKDMFIFLVKGSRFTVNREPLLSILGEGTKVDYHAHIDMKTAQGYVVPWLASQADVLANDWSVVG